ncbi:MAG: hypothetical protein WCC27_05115 [Acidobacteriaceae bacterium]
MTRENAALRVFVSRLFLHRAVRRFAPLSLLMLLLACSAATPAWAQSAGTGTITGTVTDKSRAVINTASVLITDTDTGVAHTNPVTATAFTSRPFSSPAITRFVFPQTASPPLRRPDWSSP